MDDIFEIDELQELNVPTAVLPELHAWSEFTMQMLELARDFGNGSGAGIGKGYKVAHLDAVDWLFYCDSNVPGSFGFVLDFLSEAFGYPIDIEAARESLLKKKVFFDAKKRFDDLLNHASGRQHTKPGRWEQIPLISHAA